MRSWLGQLCILGVCKRGKKTTGLPKCRAKFPPREQGTAQSAPYAPRDHEPRGNKGKAKQCQRSDSQARVHVLGFAVLAAGAFSVESEWPEVVRRVRFWVVEQPEHHWRRNKYAVKNTGISKIEEHLTATLKDPLIPIQARKFSSMNPLGGSAFVL